MTGTALAIRASSLSKSYRCCGYRAGWMVVSGNTEEASDYIEGLTMLSNMRLLAHQVQDVTQLLFLGAQVVRSVFT